jgi:hypothetical protein
MEIQRIRAELIEAGAPEADAPEIAQNIAHLANTEHLNDDALLLWIHDRPQTWRPADFLQWCRRYAFIAQPQSAAPGPTPR